MQGKVKGDGEIKRGQVGGRKVIADICHLVKLGDSFTFKFHFIGIGGGGGGGSGGGG